MFYPSNERDYFSLSAAIFNSEYKHESKKKVNGNVFFYFYVSMFYILSNNFLSSLKICMRVGSIYFKRRMSQINFSNPSFYFMSKNG